MYKQCKTEQSAARQRLLEQGFLELMEQIPYDALTVSDICVHLNIPRKTFYRYFPTKEDALHCLIDHTLLDMASTVVDISPEGEHRFQWEMRRVFTFWSQQQRFLNVMQQNNLTHLLFQRITPLVLSEMRLFGDPSSAELPHSEYVVDFFTGGMITIILRWQSKGYVESIEQMSATAAALLRTPALGHLISIS